MCVSRTEAAFPPRSGRSISGIQRARSLRIRRGGSLSGLRAVSGFGRSGCVRSPCPARTGRRRRSAAVRRPDGGIPTPGQGPLMVAAEPEVNVNLTRSMNAVTSRLRHAGRSPARGTAPPSEGLGRETKAIRLPRKPRGEQRVTARQPQRTVHDAKDARWRRPTSGPSPPRASGSAAAVVSTSPDASRQTSTRRKIFVTSIARWLRRRMGGDGFYLTEGPTKSTEPTPVVGGEQADAALIRFPDDRAAPVHREQTRPQAPRAPRAIRWRPRGSASYTGACAKSRCTCHSAGAVHPS